ncbi:MAG: carboxypeptidase regulatory-like domain-containing protein, partial [Blastocatellia bacterium]
MWGQATTATITGIITDPSGAPIVGATVTAIDQERGTTFSGPTNGSGIYNLQRLPAGNYTLSVEATGFQKAVQPAFTLVLNQVANLNIQLKVGQVTQVVEVNSGPPIMQTQTSELSTVIDAKTNVSLPLAARNYIQLTLLAPGSVTPNPQTLSTAQRIDNGGRPYINGNREQSNNFLLDGMDNNQVSDNLVGYQPSPDAIQEFNLITQNAPAEFGNFSGGVVSVSLKSGTNQYHGDAFEFFRNNILNANSWQNGLVAPGTPAIAKAALRWNQYGATFGGPIIKNKLFFFTDYQGQRFDHPTTTNAFTVFTAGERAGDFGILCTGQNGTWNGAGTVCT